MRKPGDGRVAAAVAAAVVTAALLLGASPAAAQLDQPSFHANPAKYLLYRCPQLAVARPPLLRRKAELEALMARAESGPGGALASMLAYRNEYLAVQGDLENLDARAAALKCPPPAPQQAVPPPAHRQKPRRATP